MHPKEVKSLFPEQIPKREPEETTEDQGPKGQGLGDKRSQGFTPLKAKTGLASGVLRETRQG